jgi:hypothetical protein
MEKPNEAAEQLFEGVSNLARMSAKCFWTAHAPASLHCGN